MKIEIKKEISALSGLARFNVYVDSWYKEGFYDYDMAIAYVDRVIAMKDYVPVTVFEKEIP